MGAVKELFMERCEKWARELDCYGIQASADEVATEIWTEKVEVKGEDFSFMWELDKESFTDTAPREAMAEAIAKSRIGMEVPTYGDSEEYKLEYHRKMEEWIAQNSLSL
jgi:hypothetical protein